MIPKILNIFVYCGLSKSTTRTALVRSRSSLFHLVLEPVLLSTVNKSQSRKRNRIGVITQRTIIPAMTVWGQIFCNVHKNLSLVKNLLIC